MSLSNNQLIQQADLAGKSKLTLVSIGFRGRTKSFFVKLGHDSRGVAILPHPTHNMLAEKCHTI